MSGFERVVVVGAGLIGGSVARRLLALGRPVTVVDPDAGTRAAAADLGASVAEQVPADADLVVVATPLDALPAALADAAAAAAGAIVVDVGSVKQAPAAAAARAGLGDRYVGCHPMAGTEHTGIAHSDADLLVGATWAIAHTGGTAETARVVTWAVDGFDATVVVLDAAAHDRAVARVSHAPHALAHALLAVGERADYPGVAGLLAAGSFTDGTRVAGRNPVRTLNMLAENAAALAPVLDELLVELTALRDELGDPGALGERLTAIAAADAPLRRPQHDFTACGSVADAVASARADRTVLVVRRRAGVLETAVAGRGPG